MATPRSCPLFWLCATARTLMRRVSQLEYQAGPPGVHLPLPCKPFTWNPHAPDFVPASESVRLAEALLRELLQHDVVPSEPAGADVVVRSESVAPRPWREDECPYCEDPHALSEDDRAAYFLELAEWMQQQHRHEDAFRSPRHVRFDDEPDVVELLPSDHFTPSTSSTSSTLPTPSAALVLSPNTSISAPRGVPDVVNILPSEHCTSTSTSSLLSRLTSHTSPPCAPLSKRTNGNPYLYDFAAPPRPVGPELCEEYCELCGLLHNLQLKTYKKEINLFFTLFNDDGDEEEEVSEDSTDEDDCDEDYEMFEWHYRKTYGEEAFERLDF